LSIAKSVFWFQFELLDDYEHPSPIPDDLLIQHSLEANQGYIVLGTKGSGTSV
jgi:hypothetical protein